MEIQALGLAELEPGRHHVKLVPNHVRSGVVDVPDDFKLGKPPPATAQVLQLRYRNKTKIVPK